MKPRTTLLTLLALILLAGALTAAPPPLTAPFYIARWFVPTGQVDHRKVDQPAAAALANGDFITAWYFEMEAGSQKNLLNGLNARAVSFEGKPGKEYQYVYSDVDPDHFWARCPAIAATGPDSYVVAYRQQLPAGAEIIAANHVISNSFGLDWSVGCPAIAARPDGLSVVTWANRSLLGPFVPSAYLFRILNASGEPIGPEIYLDGPGSNLFDPPAVGMDRTGRFVVVWRGISSPGLLAWRIAPDGNSVEPAFLIAAKYASDPVISMAPEGDFAVAYTKPAPAGQPQALVIRRFAADNSEIGVPVSPGTVAEFISPKASTDRYGNFVLYWQEKGRTRAQIFNRSRAARGEPFDIGPAGAVAALADSGRLLTAWPAGNELRGRIWRGLKEDSYCVYRGNALLCDAAGSGQPVETATLGLGYPTDIPLLGDVDGDGRVDACTHRGNRFLCDTKHDGGTAEVKIAFGQPGEPALLGDVDGDGRADPCIHRGALFLCDTKHDGGTADVKIAFGVPGDLGLLGDVNGDGKADVCIYRSGVFACDTAHDGVFAELKLDLRPALQGITAGVPLLGDVDGDGRADACLLRGAELTCGLFDKTGGAPYAIVERPVFLQPGDWPLLGGLVN